MLHDYKLMMMMTSVVGTRNLIILVSFNISNNVSGNTGRGQMSQMWRDGNETSAEASASAAEV